MDTLHIIVLFCDHLTKIRHHNNKIFATILLLDQGNIYCCLQLSAYHSLENVADFSAIINATVVMINKALHIHELFIVKCNILVQISSLLLICSFFSASVACMGTWSSRNLLWTLKNTV